MNSPYSPGQPPYGPSAGAYAPVQSPPSPAYGNGQQPLLRVTVTDINMSFLSMVGFMIKWALASIPAAIILMMIGSVVWAVVAGMVVALLGSHR